MTTIMENVIRPRVFSGAKLRAARGRMTQTKAAARCGVPLDTYRAYESGRVDPSVDRLAALAAGLGVQMDTLMEEVDQ